MKLRIQLLDRFELYREGDDEPWPVRSYAKIYSILALNLGEFVPRRTILATVWQGQDQAVAANRLRVALSDFRKSFGKAFVEVDNRIGFDPTLVDVDLANVSRQIRELADEVDETTELSRLASLIPEFSKQLLPGLDDEWVHNYQREWQDSAEAALRRLAELAADDRNHSLVAEAARAGLCHDPYSDAFWVTWLTAKCALGDLADGLRQFVIARKRLREDFDTDFRTETLDLVRDLRQGLTADQGVTRREADFYTDMMRGIIEFHPEFACELIDQKSTFNTTARYTEVTIPMIQGLLERVEYGSEPWIKAATRLICIRASLNDAFGALALREQLLQMELPRHHSTIVDIYCSFALFQVRRYDEAIEAIDRAIEKLTEDGNQLGADRCLTNKGSFLWHTGRFEEALELYHRALAAEDGDDMGSQTSIGIIHNNIGFLHIYQENEAAAEPHQKQGLQIFQTHRYEHSLPMLLPVYGYVTYYLHQSREGIDLMVQGIRFAFRKGHIRAQQIALDFVAGMFVVGGMFEHARAAFAYAGTWREATSHQRSIAEEGFHQRFLAMCPPAGAKSVFKLDVEPSQFLNDVIRALRRLPIDSV